MKTKEAMMKMTTHPLGTGKATAYERAADAYADACALADLIYTHAPALDARYDAADAAYDAAVAEEDRAAARRAADRS